MSGGTQPPPGVPPYNFSLFDVGLFFLGGVTGWLAVSLIQFLLASYRSGRQTTEAEFKIALESNDLALLSNYLKGRLGSLTVHDYVGKSKPRERVDLYIAKLTDFVGRDGSMVSIASDLLPEKPLGDDLEQVDNYAVNTTPADLAVFDRNVNDFPIIRSAREMVKNGSVWTALATLRRDVEKRLQPLASGRTIQAREVELLLGLEVAKNYERFRRVANRAIHGEDIKIESAQAAINSARQLYSALEERGLLSEIKPDE